ncbi:MAG: GNAT family N-acetyltransferase, partial [Pseudomonadota bacterium]
SRRSKKSLKRLAEKRRSMERVGPVVIREVKHSEERRAAIGEALVWKSEQLEKRGARNPFSDPRAVKFLTAVAGIESTDTVRVFELTCAGVRAAVVMAVMSDDELIYYINAINKQRFFKFSPGDLLLLHLFEICYAEELRFFDFGLGDEAYKNLWADEHPGIHVALLPLSQIGRIGCMMERWLLQAASYAKRSSQISRWAYWLNRVMRMRS